MTTNKNTLTTHEMQQRVDTYISKSEIGYFSPLAQIARLTEELGEMAREVNHHFGEKPKKITEHDKAIEDELGDMLFVLISFANSLDIDLSDAFVRSITKIETRDKDRWKQK
ncbi:nucleotide pyrophosphohydrolase [Virgibacillus sp. DJP39]|uniref:nucleotide pyrophosphohydrolase n=1 Tax=Virgibacillus sp. DJP39 TaxID=3409790 RepID=UPI003BB6602D